MTTDMTKGDPMKLIVRFAIPLMAGNVFQQLYNFVDTVVVGRFIGSDALAAVGTTGNIISIMNSLMMGLSVGAGIVIAQLYGMRKIDKLKQAMISLFQLITVITLVLSVTGFLLAQVILQWIHVPDYIIGDSVTYLRIICTAMFAMAFYNGAASILRSIGDSKTPLIAMVVSSLINIGCNLLFVLAFHMGVEGVAYGTFLAELASAIICIIRLKLNCNQLNIQFHSFSVDKKMIRMIIKAGIPTAIQSSLISMGGMSVQSLVNTFGTVTMSAYAAVQRVDSITIQVVVAIANALSVFTGQNIGSKDFKRIKEALHKTLILMMISCLVMAALVLCLRRQILSIFLDPVLAADSIEIGCTYMSIIVVAYMIAGVMNSYLNLIRGAGDVNASLLAGIAEIAGRIIFAYLLVIPFGVTGIWIATPLSWGCGCIYSVLRYHSGKWKNHMFVS